jgi:2-methylcitrate dehydratase
MRGITGPSEVFEGNKGFMETISGRYEGFRTRPMGWDAVVQKFERLSTPYTNAALRREMVAAVGNLEAIPVSDLARLLARAQVEGA